jgi:hypothetical protein
MMGRLIQARPAGFAGTWLTCWAGTDSYRTISTRRTQALYTAPAMPSRAVGTSQ